MEDLTLPAWQIGNTAADGAVAAGAPMDTETEQIM